MEKLVAHIRACGQTQSQFAPLIGVTQASLSKMCRGVIRPSLETALKIEAVTEGAVPVSAWSEVAPS